MQYWVMKEDPHPPERTAFIFEVSFENILSLAAILGDV